MQIKEREANAARALFLSIGKRAGYLISAVEQGQSMVEELDIAAGTWGLPLAPSTLPMWGAGSCGGGTSPIGLLSIKAMGLSHAPIGDTGSGGSGRSGPAAIVKAMGQQESRNSAEADAAQKLFVDFGFSSDWVISESNPNGWGLIAHLSAECWAQNRTEHQYPPRRSWALRPSQMPMWDTGSCGGGKTAAHIGSLVHNEVYELLRANKAHQLKEQALVARAAYKLGQLSASEDRKERKSAIKRNLVQGLVDAGVRLGDVQTIMYNMLKELNNV